MNSRSIFATRAFSIGIHLAFWLGWLFFPFLFMDSYKLDFKYFMRNGFLLLLLAIFFYTNYYILIAKYLLKRKVWQYFILIIVAFSALSVTFYLWGYVQNYFGVRNRHFPMVDRFLFPFFPTLFVFALSTAIRITNEWFKNEKIRKEMENEKLTSELAFLKSQVNPHFLFNTLNNICALARKKSDDTEVALIKLSHMMRYMLYESKGEKVALEKEIEYLYSYIDLQRMRLSEHVPIELKIYGEPGTRKIEPMLLIPFVENAFKHGVSYQDKSNIEVRIEIYEDSLTFQVENKIVAKCSEAPETDSGIGLGNVQRRLQLLYPDKHSLRLHDDGSVYNVVLKLYFDK